VLFCWIELLKNEKPKHLSKLSPALSKQGSRRPTQEREKNNCRAGEAQGAEVSRSGVQRCPAINEELRTQRV
jgi:hypothetical protein